MLAQKNELENEKIKKSTKNNKFPYTVCTQLARSISKNVSRISVCIAPKKIKK
jgi:hypothetical protein